MKVNLHIHSIHSDGVYPVKDVINTLYRNQFDLITLSDHDTIDGVDEAKKLSHELGMKFINGIEISALNRNDIPFWDHNYLIHILGLGYDYDLLKEILEARKVQRRHLAKQLFDHLIRDGYKLKNQLIDFAHEAIAKELVYSGYAKNRADAYMNVMYRLYPQYQLIPFGIKEAIDLIHSVNGIVIWAHPYEVLHKFMKSTLDVETIKKCIEVMKTYQLDGIESHYASYDQNRISQLKQLAKEYHLLESSGSDFHGVTASEYDLLNLDCLFRNENDSIIQVLLNKAK